MAKKPSPAQLKARAKFTAMAKARKKVAVSAKSRATGKTPSKRLKARRAKNTAPGYYPNPTVRKPQKYVVKVVTFKGQVGYLTPSGGLDTEHAKASKLSKASAETKAHEVFGKHRRHLHTVEVVNAKKHDAGYRKNPVPASSKARANDAAELFENFTGHRADGYHNITLPDNDVALQFGVCDGIMYETVRDGVVEHYIHKFKKSARPAIAASHDGKRLLLVGGQFRFTDRGIVDQ